MVVNVLPCKLMCHNMHKRWKESQPSYHVLYVNEHFNGEQIATWISKTGDAICNTCHIMITEATSSTN